MVKRKYGYSFWNSVFFCVFVTGLSERYSEIYEGGGDASQHAANFGKKWRGYTSIVELAGGDITKFKEITEQPLEACLLYLCFKSDKNVMEGLIHRENLKKYR